MILTILVLAISIVITFIGLIGTPFYDQLMSYHGLKQKNLVKLVNDKIRVYHDPITRRRVKVGYFLVDFQTKSRAKKIVRSKMK